MLISGRQAANELAAVGLPREQARRLLLAGFAGPAERVSGTLLYDYARVRALVHWPVIERDQRREACPHGLFVQRSWRGIDVRAPFEETLARLRLRWWLSPFARVQIRAGIDDEGGFPFVLLVSGYVAFVADIVGLRVHHRKDTELVLGGPGSRAVRFRGHRLDVPVGGPWLLWCTR